MRNPGIYLIVLACVVVGSAAIVFAYERTDAPSYPKDGTLAEQTTYWENRIRAVGPSAAYEELNAAVADENPSRQHEAGHIFGSALYATAGLSGISTCDARLTSGCFHQFVGSAIAANGLSVVTELNADCGNKPGCQHGIGHGLVSYLGYTDDALKKAVHICTDLPGPETKTLQGCLGGIFMEYNMRTMLSVDGGSARSATSSKDLLAPCDEFSGIVERSCLLYQPQWWWSFYSKENVQQNFRSMAHLCDRMVGDYRAVCYAGIGEMTPSPSDYDASSTSQLCLHTTADTVMQSYCLDGAALVLSSVRGYHTADAVCAVLSGEPLSVCESTAQNSATIDTL